MLAPTPLVFLEDVIGTWEGLFTDDPRDPGNWITMGSGTRKVVGTMRGVTPAVYAAHKGISPDSITPEMMKAITLEEAAQIGVDDFYKRYHFDLLPWGPATASLVDFGWGSGPAQAAKSMQRLVGVGADGVIGPATAKAYMAWEVERGWSVSTKLIHDMREAFYRSICQTHPELACYLQGWINRDNWASAANPSWWSKWVTV